ncbi:MAG: DMP19 family protein [Akkermansiaceae bacterium]|jgi:hypothetical protein|nr:DMP19 family protein [Akkermansiaceae bacterium]
MKRIIARLRYFFTGKYDPMDLLNGIHNSILPKRLTLSRGMLKSDGLAYSAGDLVAVLYLSADDNEFSFAQKLRKLPKHWGTLQAVMHYDCEVNNGGHDQYFENSEGAYLDLVEDGLKLYGSDYHLNIFQRALYRYRPTLHTEYAVLDINRPSGDDNERSPYHDLDGLYFMADPSLPDLVDKFIRCNLELYKR